MTKVRSPFLKESMQKEKKKKEWRQGVRVPTEEARAGPKLAAAPRLHGAPVRGGGGSKLELATPRW